MIKLDSARVSRGGRTSNTWTREPTEVRLYDKALALKFSLRSKGGGITDVLLEVDSVDFSSVLASMLKCDRKKTLQLIASTLKDEIEREAELEQAKVRAIRRSVVEAAERAFREAPEGRDHAERLTRDMVTQLVDQLDKADDESGGAATATGA
jgi:hypothetical protein